MFRRLLILLAVALPLLSWGASALAGSYLNRAALLVDGARADRDMTFPRSDDKELLRVVHRVAAARADAASHMTVPKAVAPAHPHLLLVLENCERAYAAALDGDRDKFVEHLLRARIEDKTFRALLRKLGYSLPPTR